MHFAPMFFKVTKIHTCRSYLQAADPYWAGIVYSIANISVLCNMFTSIHMKLPIYTKFHILFSDLEYYWIYLQVFKANIFQVNFKDRLNLYLQAGSHLLSLSNELTDWSWLAVWNLTCTICLTCWVNLMDVNNYSVKPNSEKQNKMIYQQTFLRNTHKKPMQTVLLIAT